MSDDASALPWTPQQWATLRGVIQEAADKSRVASKFLPIEGGIGKDQSTVPANRIEVEAGVPPSEPNRLITDAGETLHLTTISCQVHLRGAEVADPNLEVAKSLVRRAAEVLGRLEDHIIFNGLDHNSDPAVEPRIFKISGGRGHLGLLQAPAELKRKNAAAGKAMSIGVEAPSRPDDPTIVQAVITAVQTLEGRGHFGPFAVALGNELYKRATAPAGIEALAPVLRIAPFLGGGEVLRSSTIPQDKGVVVALGGQPVELVLACDMDLSFLQVTLEPRCVLRVYEKFVLRIKELDSVCRLKATPGSLDIQVAKGPAMAAKRSSRRKA